MAWGAVMLRAGHNQPEVSDEACLGRDGKTLASGSDVVVGDGVPAGARGKGSPALPARAKDSGIKLWDVATGKERATLKGHTQRVWSVAYSPDGKTLASGGEDGTVKLWDVATDK
jgi:WD40 repeat protein